MTVDGAAAVSRLVAGVCRRVGCTAPAVVVIADLAGDRTHVCPACYRDARRAGGGSLRPVGPIPHTPSVASGDPR